MEKVKTIFFKCSLTLLFYVAMITAVSGQTNTIHKTGKLGIGPLYVGYAIAGLGSNMGSKQPTLGIYGTKFIYTSEQNSYYGKRTLEADTISTGTISAAAVDSIISLVKGMKDTSIFESNPCIMSGAIHYFSIATGNDTLSYDMMNTFDYIPLKIVKIVNPYLPKDKQLWADEQLIKDGDACRERMKKEMAEEDKKKKK